MSQLEETIRDIVRDVIREEVQSVPTLPRPLLNADQVGEILGIDRQSVYRLGREGALRTIHISENRYRWQIEEIERFVREGGSRKPCLKEVAPRKVRA